MEGYIFYATNLFLEKVAQENQSNPAKLQDAEHYLLYFNLFKYKVKNKNRSVLYVPREHYKLFKESDNFDVFIGNVILSSTFGIDSTFQGNLGNNYGILVECATYKSGEEANYDIVIICCQEEYEAIKEIVDKGNYPVKVSLPKEAIELIDSTDVFK